jgi:riboflavin kinase
VLLQLGIPTANIPPEGLSAYPDLPSGVYYGFISLQHTSQTQILPAVLSIGYNPFYKNTMRSVEIHVLHTFHEDFYGAGLNLLMLGYIRPEYDYEGVESLIEDIKVDCEVARRSLERSAYQKFAEEGVERKWLEDFGWRQGVDAKKVEDQVLKKE